MERNVICVLKYFFPGFRSLDIIRKFFCVWVKSDDLHIKSEYRLFRHTSTNVSDADKSQCLSAKFMFLDLHLCSHVVGLIERLNLLEVPGAV